MIHKINKKYSEEIFQKIKKEDRNKVEENE